MAEIYRRAQEVIVWLGPADEDALMCRALYERLARPILQLSDDEELAGRKPPAQVTDLDPGDARLWSLLRSAPLDPAKRSWQAHINFHRRSWFWRVWVVQEFAFASRMTILCGHLTFPERYIPRSKQLSGLRHAMQRDGTPFDEQASRWMSLVYGTTSAEAWIAYVIYLAKSSRKEVRNPKDIIFGFIGMVPYITQMQGGKETHTKDLFDIHYTMDLDRLYAHFTAQILLKVPHLAILSLTSPDAASGHDRLSRTWIPDLRFPNARVSTVL
ncbi:hypothetical protein PV05_06797 [Exophiala xenobiotica]|uniref:Heterokaryon incompatibility domain-containing protein n=1 Tax=Exophiala xenobiotica TaxID=348802 RepID=A0A0D2CWC3_9EURO|nr:uncharacterized protein PV05_06797 [Exophiala xenobiotica]KIW54437.1 hypothetical protein PV05_06797 [Exophiala xenobiotica]